MQAPELDKERRGSIARFNQWAKSNNVVLTTRRFARPGGGLTRPGRGLHGLRAIDARRDARA